MIINIVQKVFVRLFNNNISTINSFCIIVKGRLFKKWSEPRLDDCLGCLSTYCAWTLFVESPERRHNTSFGVKIILIYVVDMLALHTNPPDNLGIVLYQKKGTDVWFASFLDWEHTNLVRFTVSIVELRNLWRPVGVKFPPSCPWTQRVDWCRVSTCFMDIYYIQGLVNVPFWGFVSHHQDSHICWRWNIPFLVGWCETLGHRNQPLTYVCPKMGYMV